MAPINRLRAVLAFAGYAGIGAAVGVILALLLSVLSPTVPLPLAVWVIGGAVVGLAVCAAYTAHLLRVRKRMIDAEGP